MTVEDLIILLRTRHQKAEVKVFAGKDGKGNPQWKSDWSIYVDFEKDSDEEEKVFIK